VYELDEPEGYVARDLCIFMKDFDFEFRSFNATFSSISVISWRPVLVVEEEKVFCYTHFFVHRYYLGSNFLQKNRGPGGSMCKVVGSNSSYKPITNAAWIRAQLCNLQKRVHSTRSGK
jgi:hypothetical protein